MDAGTPSNYIAAAMKMKTAEYEVLSDDQTWYGHIPGFQGVYANADTLAACQRELQDVLEGWIAFRLGRGLPVPESVEDNESS